MREAKQRQRLTILYVGSLPPHPGGGAISCAQLLVGFARLGHRVRAVAPITPDALRPGDGFASSHPEIGVTRFMMPYFDTQPQHPPPASYRGLEREHILKLLPRLIADEPPDILLVRETVAPAVADFATAHSLPCILLVRGNPLVTVLNGTYPEALATQSLEMYGKFHLIAAPAQHMVDGLRQRGYQNVKMIANAIDLGQFSPGPKNATLLRELAIGDDDIVIVHAANLNTRKRTLDIIHSAGPALRENPRLLYVIVGDGPLRTNLEEACRQERLWERFRFVGWIDYPQMPEYINLADLVVLASENEGMARVYLETQACGRVLVASDIAPAREVIVHGETGLLFRKGDIQDLAAQTLLAAGNPRLRQEIGGKARGRVQLHDLDNAVAAYVARMLDVVQQHRRAMGSPDEIQTSRKQ